MSRRLVNSDARFSLNGFAGVPSAFSSASSFFDEVSAGPERRAVLPVLMRNVSEALEKPGRLTNA